jgi:hypothetical protein
MRKQVIFTESDLVTRLFDQFRISNGPLFHYTSSQSVESIKKGTELWLTRADSFLDTDEIKYGIELFREVVSREYKRGEYGAIEKFINHLEDYLQGTYVLSLSSDPSSNHLISYYGNRIIELSENFPMLLANTAWHSIPCGDGFSNYYFNNLYEHVEGYVIYDRDDQIQLTKLAIEAILSVANNETHIVDVFHIRKIIIMCTILFKQKRYEPEQEYRVALIAKSPEKHDFNAERISNDKTIHFMKAVIPRLHRECIRGITNAS